MAISDPDVKVLWAKSGNRCAICFTSLTHDGDIKTVPVGQQAHIKGEHSGNNNAKASARYDVGQSNTERNSYANLILLCPTCHTKIDKDEQTFTVDRLHAIKEQHEQKIANAIKSSAINVTFFELADTLRHLVANKSVGAVYDLTLVAPKDKIVKNNLGVEVEKLIQTGLLGAKQVEEFLNKNVDMEYSNKLRVAFVDKYTELRESGMSGDKLFYAMLNVATNGNSDVKYMAAGLNVLVYYFQLCEVFEK